MFDKETNNIDAVIVSCPDHMHATAALWAMTRGKHVYCQKPLTRTVWEAQELEKAAAKFGVATQMGNQGYSNPGARECAEIRLRPPAVAAEQGQAAQVRDHLLRGSHVDGGEPQAAVVHQPLERRGTDAAGVHQGKLIR